MGKHQDIVSHCFILHLKSLAMTSKTKLNNENESTSWLNRPSLQLDTTKKNIKYVK